MLNCLGETEYNFRQQGAAKIKKIKVAQQLSKSENDGMKKHTQTEVSDQEVKTFRRHQYENDNKQFSADAYTVKGYRGIAWSVLGWELEPEEDTDWSGYYNRTGNVLAIMIGDDRVFSFGPDEITAISENQYCPECGQIGCHAIR